MHDATSFVLEPPALGFRVQHDAAGDTTILAIDDGARGKPLFGLLVPVVEADGRLASRGTSETVQVVEDRPPYVLRFPRARWPAGHASLLLLLVYYKAVRAGYSQAEAAACRVDEEIGRLLLDPAKTADALRKGILVDTSARARTRSAPESTTFALTSCLYPCDILDHMPADRGAARGPADESLLRLGRLLDRAAAPTLLLMCGDQVYVDATAGLFDPKSMDDRFRNPYLVMYASRGPQSVFRHRALDVRMMLDDHEISDNWDSSDDPAVSRDRRKGVFDAGIASYWLYQRSAETPKDHVYDSFTHRGLHVFLADTRTERQPRSARDFRERKIMSDDQFDTLKRWLCDPARAEALKVVLTPCMLLPRRLSTADDETTGLYSDSWDGFPHSQHALLRHLCDHEIRHVVFVSGDEHLGCVADVTVAGGGKQARFHSIHCPALYAPYPFANAASEDFAERETFPFGEGYRCRVEAEFPTHRDGFVLVTSSARAGGGFDLKIRFACPTAPTTTKILRRSTA